VVLIDARGAVLGRSGRPTPRDPDDLSIDGIALLGAVEDLVLEACGSRLEVRAVCAAGVGEDGFLVDERFQPVHRALAWFDPRRLSIFQELGDWVGDEVLDVWLDPARTLVGWAWSARQNHGNQARSWLSVTDFVTAHWSGRSFLSDTLASRTAAWRASDRSWRQERIAGTLGDEALVPDVLRAGEVVGSVRSGRLAQAGVLGPETLAVVGGHDHPIGGWGVHRLQAGAVLDSMGTAEVVVAQSPRAPGARPPRVDIAPGILSGGSTLLRVEELARNVAWASQDPVVGEEIRRLISGESEPTAELEEETFRPGTRGGGLPMYLAGAPARAEDRASAVLGALARMGRDAVEAVRRNTVPDAPVRLAGGWGRSPGWVAIKSRVNGFDAAPIREPEVTAVGAALLAAQALGWEPDPAAALGEHAAS